MTSIIFSLLLWALAKLMLLAGGALCFLYIGALKEDSSPKLAAFYLVFGVLFLLIGGFL